MRMKKMLFLLASLVLLGATSAWATPTSVLQAPNANKLAQGFATPPADARPWVYWFWSAGNVTREGITADLEAMKRVGIGGVLIMEVDQGIPAGPAVYLGPEWRALYKHMIAEAGRLGIEVNMNNDGGWCGSGGPWITPEQSMQVVTWSETTLTGPSKFDGTLAQPQTTENFYRDITVLAFPSPAAEAVRMAECSPKLTLGQKAEGLDPKVLIDGNAGSELAIPLTDPKTPQYVQIEFPKPFPARALSLSISTLDGWQIPYHTVVQASQDGKEFKTICEFDLIWPGNAYNFPLTSARYFRITFPVPLQPGNILYEKLRLGEIELLASPRIEGMPGKAACISNTGQIAAQGVAIPPEAAVNREGILDLGAKMDKTGRLTWDVPAGKWTVLRLGHTSTGKKNHPAPAGSLGLECDKLDPKAIETHFDHLIGRLLKEYPGKALKATHIDSWEVGSQNWSPRIREEFTKRCGYDPVPLLPILTGRAVGSKELSERFLWDLRRTVADMVNDNYADHMRKISNEHGLRLSIEAYGDGVLDILSYAGQADEPMGEFWMSGGCIPLSRAMASAGHIYGKPVIGAEAFTSEANLAKWQNHPYQIKALGDGVFCEGINRFVFHRYAMQPWLDIKPGMTMGPWGLHYERTETWWEQSKPWHEYLARCQYILQRGQFVADLVYLYGEQAPNSLPARDALTPPPPAGYDYDGCPAEAVLSRMSVKDGRITVQGDMSYRLLVLPQDKTMTPPMLRKIKQLIEAGATVVANSKPTQSPSLVGYPRCDGEVTQLANEIWGNCDGETVKEHRLGKGRIVWGTPLAKLLGEMNAQPDFTAQRKTGEAALRYIHRTIGEAEVYFVSNPWNAPESALCSFRVTDRQPELWWPDTGRIESVGLYEQVDGRVRLPIALDPSGSVFVVFRPKAKTSPQAVTSVAYNGKTILSTEPPTPPAPATTDKQAQGANANITDTFTMAFWVKPRINTFLPPEANSGITAQHPSENDAIYPAPGHEVYEQKGQACAGVAVGQNGICVVAHGDSYYPPLLVHAAPITDWTHVAVVFKDGTPSLYLDGKFIRKGMKSLMSVHPSIGVQHNRPVTPFIGAVSSLRQFDKALSETEIAELLKAPRPADSSEQPLTPTTVAATGKNYKMQVWQTGEYEFKTAQGQQIKVNVPAMPAPLAIAGPWHVGFPKGWGAPESITLEKLIPWNTHTNPGVKYFSGTATYQKKLNVPAEMFGKNRRLHLDLGVVQVIAQVKLNGKDLGILWKPPFQVDITDAAKAGENELEIQVTNLWPNRLIGDEQLPEDCEWIMPQDQGYGALKQWPEWLVKKTPRTSGRLTFATWKHYLKDSALLDSGLLGPVTLRSSEWISVKP